MNIKELRLVAEGLEDGQTIRDNCPACGREKTFTITRRDGSTLYNCYSTHCNFRGGFGQNLRVNLVRTKSDKPLEPFTGELRELDDGQKAFLEDRIGFGQWHLDRSGVRYAPVEDRYAFPIFSPNGARRGWILRSYSDGNVRRKVLTRMDVAGPHMSWYGVGYSKGAALVVEDIPSAVRAANHFPGAVVAMCAGGIGPDYVNEIAANAKQVVWAFDPDAFASALKHHTRYGLSFESSSVLRLVADLKDLDEPTLMEVLKSCVNQKN